MARTFSPGWAGLALAFAAALAPGMALVLAGFVASEAAAFLVQRGPLEVLLPSWNPVADRYGMSMLVCATVLMVCGAGFLAVLVGTPAAVRLACWAGPWESRLAHTALGALAGLPSIIVGLIGLAWITPRAGYSLAAGMATLFMTMLPGYVLLAASAVRRECDRRWPTCRALGLTPRQFAYGEAMRGALPSLMAAATLAMAKGLGEATAISLVIGNVGGEAWPGLFEPASSLATVILKDHGGAAGLHRSSLFVAACVLMLLVAAFQLAGAALAHAARRWCLAEGSLS